MIVPATVQPGPLSDPAQRDSRPTRSRRAGEHQDERLAGVSGVVFESLLSVTTRVADATRGRATEASAATQMFEAPVDAAHERRGRAMKSQDQSSLDQTARDARSDRSSVSARLARAQRASTDHVPSKATSRASQSAGSDRGANTAVGSDLQSQDVGLDGLMGSEKAGDPSVRGHSSSASTNRGPAAVQTMDARSATRGGGTTGAAVALTSTNESGRVGSASSNDPAQQIARILSSARGGVESARAVDSSSSANGGPSTNTGSRTMNPSAKSDSAAEARSPESNTAGEKANATQRATPFDELIRSIRLNAGARQSSAKLQLDPPELGRLSVEVRIVADQAEIKVQTETPAARLLVRQRASELTDALERHGLHIERFEVTSEPLNPQASAFATGDGSQGAATRRGREGLDATGRRDERVASLGDTGAPTRSAADGRSTVEHGVGAESRLDIRV